VLAKCVSCCEKPTVFEFHFLFSGHPTRGRKRTVQRQPRSITISVECKCVSIICPLMIFPLWLIWTPYCILITIGILTSPYHLWIIPTIHTCIYIYMYIYTIYIYTYYIYIHTIYSIYYVYIYTVSPPKVLPFLTYLFEILWFGRIIEQLIERGEPYIYI
jgi:hypothetical protein